MQNQPYFSKAFFNKMRVICERQIVNTTEKIVTNEQQRIAHPEKLADDAGKTLAFLQSRVDTLTAERDQLIQKNTALMAENAVILQDRAQILKELDDTCAEIGMRIGEKAEDYPCPTVVNTDAAIAAIRAEGVDLAIVLHKKINGSKMLS